MQEFRAAMGPPVHVDEFNGLTSLVYDHLYVSGYPVFMVAFFSPNGLESGAYYFHTFSLEELMQCYRTIQAELLEQFGATSLFDPIMMEFFPYESSWNLSTGYVKLKVDTRRNEPVTLLFSSPELSRRMGM
jgi:hypothetical protein